MVMLPLAVLAVTSAATSSMETSPLAVLKSTSPTGPLISMSADAVATATSAPFGHLDPHRHRVAAQETHAVHARQLHHHDVAVPDGRHSTVARSTSSSAPGVSASIDTTVRSAAPAVHDHQSRRGSPRRGARLPGSRTSSPCPLLLSGRAVAAQAVARPGAPAPVARRAALERADDEGVHRDALGRRALLRGGP